MLRALCGASVLLDWVRRRVEVEVFPLSNQLQRDLISAGRAAPSSTSYLTTFFSFRTRMERQQGSGSSADVNFTATFSRGQSVWEVWVWPFHRRTVTTDSTHGVGKLTSSLAEKNCGNVMKGSRMDWSLFSHGRAGCEASVVCYQDHLDYKVTGQNFQLLWLRCWQECYSQMGNWESLYRKSGMT